MLAATTSSDYYSTEYTEYESIIKSIYSKVNGALKQVNGYSWVNRKVLQDGVIANSYKDSKGNKKTIIINYTNGPIKVSGQKIDKLSSLVKEGGVK